MDIIRSLIFGAFIYFVLQFWAERFNQVHKEEDDEYLEPGDEFMNDDDAKNGTVTLNKIERPKRSNAGTGVNRLEPSLYGKEYTSSINKQFAQLLIY